MISHQSLCSFCARAIQRKKNKREREERNATQQVPSFRARAISALKRDREKYIHQQVASGIVFLWFLCCALYFLFYFDFVFFKRCVFAPDLCSRVTFVNFSVTPSSLENQVGNLFLWIKLHNFKSPMFFVFCVLQFSLLFRFSQKRLFVYKLFTFICYGMYVVCFSHVMTTLCCAS